MQLAQPVLDEIIDKGDNASFEIEETPSIKLITEKTRDDLISYFAILEEQLSLYRVGQKQYHLNTYPGLFIFTDEISNQESGTAGVTFEFRSPEETSRIEAKYYSRTKVDLTEFARRKLRTISNKEMMEEAKKILDGLRDVLDEIDTSELPPIRAFEAEDGSLLLEWILPHHRVGFSIEVNRQESSWFLVSDNYAQGIQASGFLKDENITRLIAWIIQPLMDYYASK